MNWRTKTRLAGLVSVTALLITGCGLGSDPLDTPATQEVPEQGHVRIGWVQAEQELVAEVYAGALRADGTTTDVASYDTRAELLEALRDGDLDLAPEYSGELLAFLDDEHPAVFDVQEGVAALPDVLPPELQVLDAAESGSRFVFAVPPAVTEQYDLISLEDAAGYLAGRTLGGPADFAEAPYGPSGLAGLYGVEVEYRVVTSPESLGSSLIAGEVQAAVFRSTDPWVNEVVLLDDPQRMIPDNVLIPVVRADLGDGQLAETITRVQAALDEPALLELTGNTAVPATEAAEAWLAERDLE